MAEITRGTDNVLADLGMADAEELSTKVQLAVAIRRIVEGRRLKQRETAALLAIPQSKVSALMNYKLEGFSAERLMGLLTRLDRDVEISIRKKPASRPAGRITVASAA
jgi:predicted XRE-type DNA-binding protein